jgi:hypothetical protein
VETQELGLTKLSERVKVNCGTVLCTRINIDDFVSETDAFLSEVNAGKVSGS